MKLSSDDATMYDEKVRLWALQAVECCLLLPVEIPTQ